MTIDEGYIKYDSHWNKAAPPDPEAAEKLEQCRQLLFARGLIGHYEELGVGYGNISLRCGKPRQFLITGTQTGHIETTTAQHYALITAYDIAANSVSCNGPLQASSEAMTHAALYELDEKIGAVVHVHDRKLWQQHLNILPTTDAGIAYGTPQMAEEFRRLYGETDLATLGLAVMAGHEEGLVSVGETIEHATQRIIELHQET